MDRQELLVRALHVVVSVAAILVLFYPSEMPKAKPKVCPAAQTAGEAASPSRAPCTLKAAA
jgi:hypothetical protein